MKIQIISDVHSNFANIEVASDIELLVVAGDVCNGYAEGLEWLSSIPGPVILWIPGNHERYASKNLKADERALTLLRKGQTGRVYFGERKTFQFGDVRFLCATLWHDYFGMSQTAYEITGRYLNDYRNISSSLLSPGLSDAESLPEFRPKPPSKSLHRHIYGEHVADISFLNSALNEQFNGRTVVVTHHAPLVHSAWLSGFAPVISGLNIPNYPLRFAPWKVAGYCNNLGWLIRKTKPDLWIHGHYHRSVKYFFRSSLILSNPHGHKTGENLFWRPAHAIPFNAEWLEEQRMPVLRGGLEGAFLIVSAIRRLAFLASEDGLAFLYANLEVLRDFVEVQPFAGAFSCSRSFSASSSDVSSFCDELSSKIERIFAAHEWPTPKILD